MPMHLGDIVAPVVVATLFIIATSAFKEPQRRHFNAIMIAGAGAAYLNGGLGRWEFAFTAVVTYCAYRGLNSYGFIGLGWLLHTGWDIMHHLYGNPIVPFVPTSSLGCAMCDPIIAAWCFAGAPSVYGVVTRSKRTTSGSGLGAACTEESAMDIRLDDVSGPEIAALLQEHLRDMYRVSPPASVHALDLEGLRTPDITVWTLWAAGTLAGCGALKELDPQHGEIKSMRTASSHRRRGVAKRLLQHLLAEAKQRGYTRVSLETGSMEFFLPARTLYASVGFTPCPPFADYRADPNSVFMTKEL